jgi:NhaP-type Na+/H+ or K+/H+ antiporter
VPGFAITHGLPADLAGPLVSLTLAAVATSVVVHGVSVTPLMSMYGRLKRRRQAG